MYIWNKGSVAYDRKSAHENTVRKSTINQKVDHDKALTKNPTKRLASASVPTKHFAEST